MSAPKGDVKAEGLKLTKAQLAMLQLIGSYSEGRGFRNAHFTYAPLRRLIRRRYVEQIKGSRGFAFFRITDAGRASLPPTSMTGG